MSLILLTPENNTLRVADSELIEHWANRLYEATKRRDWSLRPHLTRIMPQGLRSKILVREAQIANNCRHVLN